MNKNLPLILLIILIVALSGCTGSDSSKTDSSKISTMEVQKIEHENTKLDAKIVDLKFDREDIRAGEKVTAQLLVANTGSEKVTKETIEIKAKLKTLDDSLANIYLMTMGEEKKTRIIEPIEYEIEIEPGTVKTVSAAFNTIKEMEGRSLAGTYEITITLSVNGQKVESRILSVTLLSGTTREFTPVPTPSPTPTTTPTLTPVHTPDITAIATPTPTPEPTPYIAATPTGKIIQTRIVARGQSDAFADSTLQIDAGDQVLWVNMLERSYTIEEVDNKIPILNIRDGGRVNYIFTTTGNYNFKLNYKPMRGEPSTQTITVRYNASQ